MSVPAQSAIFSLGLQADKIGSEGTFNGAVVDFFRTRAPRSGFGVVQNQEPFPLETGGPIVPTGMFKSGQFAAGDIELIPRMQEFLGLVLYGALGALETGVDENWDTSTNAFVSGTSGVNTHKFTFDPVNSAYQPWLAVRQMVPGADPTKNFFTEAHDCKVGGVRLTVPAAGLLGMSVDFVGRKATNPLPAAGNAWTYVNTVENSTSAALAGKGEFKIGGQKYPLVQATIELANNLTSPQQEMVIGEYHPDDFVALSRGVTVRVVYKWNNPDLYRQILNGTTTATDWSIDPFQTITSGGTKALEVTFESSGNITGTTPYQMKIIADKVAWAIDRGGIQLQAGDIIMVPYVGTVVEPDEGGEYFTWLLKNGVTYTIPVPTGGNKPLLTIPATGTYGGTALTFASAGTLTDADSVNFNGGSLLVEFVGADFNPADDKLQLAAGASFSTLNVLVGATTIGTVPAALGTGDNLYITLNSSATPALLEDLIQLLQYHTVGAAARSGDVIKLRLTLTDGDGGTSIPRTITITHS